MSEISLLRLRSVVYDCKVRVYFLPITLRNREIPTEHDLEKLVAQASQYLPELLI